MSFNDEDGLELEALLESQRDSVRVAEEQHARAKHGVELMLELHRNPGSYRFPELQSAAGRLAVALGELSLLRDKPPLIFGKARHAELVRRLEVEIQELRDKLDAAETERAEILADYPSRLLLLEKSEEAARAALEQATRELALSEAKIRAERDRIYNEELLPQLIRNVEAFGREDRLAFKDGHDAAERIVLGPRLDRSDEMAKSKCKLSYAFVHGTVCGKWYPGDRGLLLEFLIEESKSWRDRDAGDELADLAAAEGLALDVESTLQSIKSLPKIQDSLSEILELAYAMCPGALEASERKAMAVLRSEPTGIIRVLCERAFDRVTRIRQGA